jgi:hypothetical protein
MTGPNGLLRFCRPVRHHGYGSEEDAPVSEIVAPGGRLQWPDLPTTLDSGSAADRAVVPVRVRDARRVLQLALAGVWLLDGVLQFQPSMFTQAFADMIGGTAAGNPALVARPITWNANLVGHHLVLMNALFAVTQLLLGLGIAFRRTVKPALAASVVWAFGVWWLGEGFGGVLNGTASPLNGAPGAVILYALLAVLLWPADQTMDAPFIAARAMPAQVARALWLVLWLSLAYFSLTPANRAPQAPASLITSVTDGEPGWLAALSRGAATAVGGHGLSVSLALAASCAVVAAGAYLPRRAAIGALLLAVVIATLIWVVSEALGGIFTGSGTDPNSGPLLTLLALAYWPAVRPGQPDRAHSRLDPGHLRGRHARSRGYEHGSTSGGQPAALRRTGGRHRHRALAD